MTNVLVVGKFGEVFAGEDQHAGEVPPVEGRRDVLLLAFSTSH